MSLGFRVQFAVFVAMVGNAWGQVPATRALPDRRAERDRDEFPVLGIDEYAALQKKIHRLINSNVGKLNPPVELPRGETPPPKPESPGIVVDAETPKAASSGILKNSATKFPSLSSAANAFELASDSLKSSGESRQPMSSASEVDPARQFDPEKMESAQVGVALILTQLADLDGNGHLNPQELAFAQWLATPRASAPRRSDPIADLRKVAGELEAGGDRAVDSKALAEKLKGLADCMQSDRKVSIKTTRNQVHAEVESAIRALKQK